MAMVTVFFAKVYMYIYIYASHLPVVDKKRVLLLRVDLCLSLSTCNPDKMTKSRNLHIVSDSDMLANFPFPYLS